VLLDAEDRASRGGTGRTIDQAVARTVAATRPTILAGGLTPETVAGAIRAVRPHGVDVSSGVESSPGVKDADRLRRFVDAVRSASCQ
jgi:phosphoribosylanthranilate isomerase